MMSIGNAIEVMNVARINHLFLLAAVSVQPFMVAACGVRGKPQPPVMPAELGRGGPSFQGATEDLAFPNVPTPEGTPVPRKDGRSGL